LPGIQGVASRSRDGKSTPRLPYDPGNWLTLNVSFSVAEDQRGGRWNNSRNGWND